MAIITAGALAGGISGNLGSINFASTSAGFVARTRPAHTNKKTQKQLFRQARYALFVTQWRALSSNNKQSWNTQAAQVPFTNRLGQTFYLSGFQYFMTTRLDFEFDVTDADPFPLEPIHPSPPTSMTADFTEGGPMDITLVLPPGTPILSARLYVSRTMSVHVPASFRSWTYAEALTYTTLTLERNWNGKILTWVGELRQGEVVGLKIQRVLPGRLLSTPLISHTVVQ